jgi:hypothetical protein
MQNKQTINYDQTKKMLNTLRKLNENKITFGNILREDDQETQTMGGDTDTEDDITVINDVDVKIISSDEMDMKMSEEDKNSISGLIDNIKSQVSNLIDFEPGLTITKEQIRLDGSITDQDINFVFIAGEENGIYINADMLKLETDVIDMVTKLQKFEQTFSTTMNEIIRKRKNN